MTKLPIAMCALALALLGGCSESPDVVIHEPGEFKGTRDPLLNQQAAARDDSLKKRFQLVQLDR